MDNQKLPLECDSITLPGIEKEEVPMPIYHINNNAEYHEATIIHKLSYDMIYKIKLSWFSDSVVQKTVLTKNNKIIHSDEHKIGYSKSDLFNVYCMFKNNDNFIPEYIYDAVYDDVLHNIECRKEAIEKDSTNSLNSYIIYPSQYSKFFRTSDSKIFLLGFLLGKLKNDKYDCFIVGDITNFDGDGENYIQINL